jgi:arylsulfatase A-like enzyme
MARRSRASRRAAGCWALVLACAGCGDASLAPIARRPVAGAPLALERRVRNAAHADPEDPVEVDVDPSPLALDFSMAAADGEATFRVLAREAGAWRTLVEERVAATAGWVDHHLPLATRATRFRFETNAPGWWGSIVFTGPPAGAPRRLPDIVLVSLDTLGADYLGTFGGPDGVSPHLDAFFASAHTFRRAYAPYPNTLVSHASLFSGLRPRRHDLYPTHLRASFPSLVQHLAEHGYRTAGFTEGAYVSSVFGFAAGFDVYDDGAGLEQHESDAQATFAKGIAWLEKRSEAPVFLFLHTYEVHSPYIPRDGRARRFARDQAPGDPFRLTGAQQQRRILRHNAAQRTLDETELRQLRAVYLGEIEYTDRVIGALLEALDVLGLSDDSIVVVTSDHGEQFGEHGKVGHGESLHNRVLHVPLAFRWQGRIAPGETPQPVALVDVMPTLFELAELPVPEGLDGRSLAPRLHGGQPPAPGRAIVSELRHARGECKRLELPWNCELGRYAVQTGRFKLVSSRVPASEVLYDLDADPLETRDVAAHHPQEVARQRRLLDAYLAAPGPASVAPPASGAARGGVMGGGDCGASRDCAIDADTSRQLEALGYLE